MSEIGDYLKKWRHDNWYTLQEVATATGISVSHIARIEKGERMPSAGTLKKISSGLTKGRGGVDLKQKKLLKIAGFLD